MHFLFHVFGSSAQPSPAGSVSEAPKKTKKSKKNTESMTKVYNSVLNSVFGAVSWQYIHFVILCKGELDLTPMILVDMRFDLLLCSLCDVWPIPTQLNTFVMDCDMFFFNFQDANFKQLNKKKKMIIFYNMKTKHIWCVYVRRWKASYWFFFIFFISA